MACPGDDSSPGDTDAAASAGSVTGSTTDASATSMGAASTATPSSADSGGDTGDTDLLCPSFADEPSPGSITIALTNNRGEGIWVPLISDCILSVPYTLTGPGGEAVPWRPVPSLLIG